MSKFLNRDILKDSILSLAGILFAGFALKSFLVPNHFLDGGVTGLALLIHETYHIPIAILIILCNIPFNFLFHRFSHPTSTCFFAYTIF